MYQVTCEIDFCYGHRLLNYDGKCKHLHGHNGKVLITLAARQLDEQSMVVDFNEIKRIVADWVNENLDHRMLLNCEDPIAKVLQDLGEPVYLFDANPTAERIAEHVFRFAVESGFSVSEVVLFETPSCRASVRCLDARQ